MMPYEHAAFQEMKQIDPKASIMDQYSAPTPDKSDEYIDM